MPKAGDGDYGDNDTKIDVDFLGDEDSNDYGDDNDNDDNGDDYNTADNIDR